MHASHKRNAAGLQGGLAGQHIGGGAVERKVRPDRDAGTAGRAKDALVQAGYLGQRLFHHLAVRLHDRARARACTAVFQPLVQPNNLCLPPSTKGA